MSFVTARQTGIDNTIKRVVRARSVLRDPQMHEAVRRMAGVWQSNFSSEGSMVGGWRPLADFTNDERERRGYPREHPILVQSGGLRRVAIDALLRVNGPQWLQAKGVSMTYNPSSSGASLRVSGTKVSNQFRIRTRNMDSPARPFWFVDRRVSNAATEGFNDWLKKEMRL